MDFILIRLLKLARNAPQGNAKHVMHLKIVVLAMLVWI